ncbi:MAG: hypothetical protein V7L04_27500 [Nostoc sp.]
MFPNRNVDTGDTERYTELLNSQLACILRN